jgi:riboflavin biosynthesis pyrimidine reductase
MPVIATLVVGSNFATSKEGSSLPLSTMEDRRRFLALHRRASAIITGRESAARENYQRTSVPIYIFTRSSAPLTLPYNNMRQVTIADDLRVRVIEIAHRHSGDIVIEAGIELLLALTRVGAIDELELSFTPITGDSHYLDIDEIFSLFEIVDEQEINATRLLKCRYKGDTSNGENNS